MIRLTLLSLFLGFLTLYAWKDWYKALCGMILLMAVVEHPDMPKALFGIQGFSPWNIGFASVVMAWISSRGKERLTWDMPQGISRMLFLYFAVVIVSFVRMMADRSGLETYSTGALVSEHLINSIKWVVPGLMLFDGCRNRDRFRFALYCLLGIYFLLGLQVIKWMPLSAATSGGGMSERSLKIISNEIGYHRVNLSMMLAGASWAIFATRPLVAGGFRSVALLSACLAVVFAQALTAGRAGYVTWGVVGLVLCIIRWRKYLLLAPLVVIAVALAAPGVVERMSQGFSPGTRDVNQRLIRMTGQGDPDKPDLYTITAGRNVAWPVVIGKIKESPLFGHGRLAMQRTGIAAFLLNEYGERFGHPHSAYLEMLLDNGLVGFILVVPFYLVILKKGIVLFRDSRSPVYVAIGGVVVSLVLALLAASSASQTFYPREGSVGMWCAIGLMLRVWVERSRISGGDGVQPPGIIGGGPWVLNA